MQATRLPIQHLKGTKTNRTKGVLFKFPLAERQACNLAIKLKAKLRAWLLQATWNVGNL